MNLKSGKTSVVKIIIVNLFATFTINFLENSSSTPPKTYKTHPSNTEFTTAQSKRQSKTSS